MYNVYFATLQKEYEIVEAKVHIIQRSGPTKRLKKKKKKKTYGGVDFIGNVSNMSLREPLGNNHPIGPITLLAHIHDRDIAGAFMFQHPNQTTDRYRRVLQVVDIVLVGGGGSGFGMVVFGVLLVLAARVAFPEWGKVL